MRLCRYIRLILGGTLAGFLLLSCSTTRLVPEGEYRLASNKIEVVGEEKVPSGELTPYLRQQSNKYFIFGWNPFLNIYNWSNGSGRGINKLWEKIGVPPVIFNPTLVPTTEDNLLRRLESLGYYNSRVSSEITTKKRLAKVKYTVEPAGRCQIDSLVFELPSDPGLAQAFYADTSSVSIRPGAFLSEKLLDSEASRSTASLRNQGFYSLSSNHYFFEADTLGPKKILYYRIRNYTRNETPASAAPLSRYYIREVNITHPKDIRIREKLLRRFNTIKPGSLYNADVVATTYHRLSALNVFRNVSIEMTPVDSAKLDCNVKLSGSNIIGFKVNLEVSSNSSGLIGISPQLSFSHKNIFHGGEWLSLQLTGNWQTKPNKNVNAIEAGVSATLSFPKALGFPLSRLHDRKVIPRSEVKLSFNYQNRPEYHRSLAGFSYGYVSQSGEKIRYQIYPIQFNLVKLYSVSDGFRTTLEENPYLWDSFTDQFDLGLGGTFRYKTNNDVVPKTPYSWFNISFDSSGNLLSLFRKTMSYDFEDQKYKIAGLPYNQYLRLEVSGGKTFRFGRHDTQALALRLVAGVGKAYGNSTALPFEKQFYCGGASGMRGWRSRELGPGLSKPNESFVIASQTGDFKLEADVEYRFKIFWKLEGGLFAEAGNIWLLRELKDSFIDSVALDWGLGLRVNLDFILLRLDAGFRVHDPARESDQRWLQPGQWFKKNGFAIHFGVGYPF